MSRDSNRKGGRGKPLPLPSMVKTGPFASRTPGQASTQWKQYFDDIKCSVLHRIDGPAVIYDDGREFWYFKGVLHRDDGPAVIIPKNAALYSYSVHKSWIVNDLLHREDGPARELHNGKVEYWLFGERIPKKKYTKKLIRQLKMTKIIET